MNSEANDLIRKSREFIDKYQTFLYYARGIEFQRYCISKSELFLSSLAETKKRMIELNDEESANAMLAIEYFLEGFVNELKMLIRLKEDKIDQAWNYLVEAQGYLRGALQASDVSMQFDAPLYLNRLRAYEELLFPPQVFTSLGMVAESSKCSICDAEYGTCDHLVGKPYMGKLCHQIVTKIKEVKELSLVTGEPGDKRCKVNAFMDNGHWRDRMTWRIIRSPKQ